MKFYSIIKTDSKYLLIIILSLLCFTVMLGTGQVYADSNNTAITIIGDSITVRSTPDLKQLLPNADINAQVGRQWETGIGVLQQIKNSGNLKNILVFALGTNGPITSADVETVLNIASGKKVIFVTIFGLGNHLSWMDSVNNVLNSEASRHNQITIADWKSLVSSHTDWIDTSDGLDVHPTIPTGTQNYAKLIADTVSQVSSGATNSTSATSQSSSSTVQSNAVVSCVGKVSEQEKKECQNQGSGSSNNSLVEAAQDLYNETVACSSDRRFTFDICSFSKNLSNTPFSANIDAALQSITPDGAGCTQCTNFVYTAVALATGQQLEPNISAAADALDYNQLTAGGDTFVKQPANTIPQPGDIGVAAAWASIANGAEYVGGAGHILIVKKPEGNVKFYALEANFPEPSNSCQVADSVFEHFDGLYTFFRKK